MLRYRAGNVRLALYAEMLAQCHIHANVDDETAERENDEKGGEHKALVESARQLIGIFVFELAHFVERSSEPRGDVVDVRARLTVAQSEMLVKGLDIAGEGGECYVVVFVGGILRLARGGE